MRAPRQISTVFTIAGVILLTACGGDGGFTSNGSTSTGTTTPASGSNVAPLSVNFGPDNEYVNGLFTSVTLCVHGTGNCQTIDNILVDTGSYGFRVLNTALTISPAVQTDSAGNSVGECAVFVDGYTWGPVAIADLSIADETASSLPVQILGSPANFPAAPAACSNGAGAEIDTVAALGANGILGIGNLLNDCGDVCATNSQEDVYFACNTGTADCTSTAESLADQVQNPVPLFSIDNNGIIIELPGIATGGQATASGSLIFGIGTESNNQLGSARVLSLDENGEFSTTYNGTSLDAFVDSGSNALFFASSIPTCNSDSDFYCPPSTESLTANMNGENNVTVTVPFSVANFENLSSENAALNDLAGPSGDSLSGQFDWGMPFFYGRTVFFAIEGQETTAGVGPYLAF